MAKSELHLDRIDAAVFDLDGVVTDTAVQHAAAWAELFEGVVAFTPHIAPFDPEADYLRYVDGKPQLDGIVSFLESRGITLPMGNVDDPPTAMTVFGLCKRKDELFHELLQHETPRVFPDAVAFLDELRLAGKPIAVVSASRNCREVLRAAHVIDRFDVIIDGVAAAQFALPGKRDPATFLRAAKDLGSAPSRTLLVEDALAGIEAGRRGGFSPIIAVDRHHRSEALRRAGADVIVADLTDVTVVNDQQKASGWSITKDESVANAGHRATDALFALGNGSIGVRGDLETGAAGRAWLSLAAGAFGTGLGGDGMVRLLPGPSLTPLSTPMGGTDAPLMRRTLHLRSGVVECRPAGDGPGLRTTRFVSLATPGLVAVRAEGESGREWPDRPLDSPRLDAAEGLAAAFTYEEGEMDDKTWWAATKSDRAQVVSVSRQRSGDGPTGQWLERLTVFGTNAVDSRQELEETLHDASQQGFGELLAEHRRVWAQRWDGADIEIDGDDASQAAIRFALFHLLSCAPTSGEAGVAARGLTGLAYAGHVFWDADVFVLPVLAATLPEAAAAMIEYRARRLPAARRLAEAIGLVGARFPWESADTGADVTPISVRDHEGEVVAILTGSHEEHVNADVAWAVLNYVDWTGDSRLFDGTAAGLVRETARYWEARVRVAEDGRAHVEGVMGPDEYHEVVDDNAFTNIMVRWHLRRAASMAELDDPEEAVRWRHLADALTDGYDAVTQRHEQFAGFWQLEPLRITDITEVPVAADVLLGRRRVANAQVIKQPDVLMAHHLVPDELPRGSLAADLDFYLPRTAQGSSLSPAICASLLARAGRSDEALTFFDLAASLDLDDLTGMTGGGLHLATFGGLWQAVVFGFAGIRPHDGVLRVDPALPARWSRLRIRLRFRHIAIRVDLAHERIVIDADGPARFDVCGTPVTGSAELIREPHGWRRR
ncbi:MAG TPA: HAD-IA family hydrolase [Acidimicrobiales bacterium]|nr:HAD-IA family hydrolase [Acidimicrobiales bacterium]